MCCRRRYSGLDFVVGDAVGSSGRDRSCGQVSAMFGKEWRWRRNGDYGFVDWNWMRIVIGRISTVMRIKWVLGGRWLRVCWWSSWW